MPRKIIEWIEVLREVKNRGWFRVLIFLWLASGAWDLALSQWIPEETSKKLPKVYQVVAMTTGLLSFQVWVLVGFVILVVGALEYASRNRKYAEQMRQHSTQPSTTAAVSIKAEQVKPAEKIVRQLSQYEAERKARVLDTILEVLRVDMQPLEDHWYLPQVGHAWNALKDPKNNSGYHRRLGDYRDLFRGQSERLAKIVGGSGEYPDIVAAATQPQYEEEIKAIEAYLVLSGQLLSYLKLDIDHDAFTRILHPASEAALKATQEFVVWRTQTRIKIEQLRVALN